MRCLIRQYLLQQVEGADNIEAKHIYYNSLQELEMRVINMVTASSCVDANSHDSVVLGDFETFFRNLLRLKHSLSCIFVMPFEVPVAPVAYSETR